MDKIIITGGKPLHGNIVIGGAKNAALPLMVSALLTNETIILDNVPKLSDVVTMAHLLISHGVRLSIGGADFNDYSGRIMLLNAGKITNYEASYDIVRKMRASVLVLGPLLARFGHARVSLPGGCAIGARAINLHLHGLKAMGAEIALQSGYIEATVKGKLKGADIHFDVVSVGATESILMAATLAEGKTTLRNAAAEPEIIDLAKLLTAMGAKISGAGTNTIEIEGVPKLSGAYHRIVPDRIEAGTYAIAAAITGGEITLEHIEYDIFSNIADELRKTGVKITHSDNTITIKGSGKIQPMNLSTAVYPGFPTDMQAQFMALLAVADGTSKITENIFENRYMHVSELNRMGTDIMVEGSTATIKGVKQLYGAEVMATDLRASVSLVLAGLVAKGQTTINRVYHLDRGYESIEDKLRKCGADIFRTVA